jgi:alpha-amylase
VGSNDRYKRRNDAVFPLVQARRYYAYGAQYDYFDHPNTIGWTRLGDEHHTGGMAVLMNNGGDGWKWMETGNANETYTDITGHVKAPVVTNNDGWGEFMCLGGKVSVWLPVQR